MATLQPALNQIAQTFTMLASVAAVCLGVLTASALVRLAILAKKV